MNGKTYRECSQHVTCCATKSSRSSLHSLVDRGSNGGASGIDVRVIETHPDLKVDIRGMDAYKITAIPLENAVGATSTIIGEVTVIMH